MIRRHVFSAAVAAFAIALLGSGCSVTRDDEIGGAEAAATPPSPTTSFALAETCVRLFKRHEAVRAIDLEQGVIRWGCGDVPGVTNDDLGQEYCEYQAVQNGAIKKKAADLAPGAPVACVFTGVFADAGQAAQLAAAMADPANLGVAAASGGVVQMRKGFNTRGAATALMRDCANAGAGALAVRLRTAACVQAASRPGAAAELAAVCKGNLGTESVWAQAQALGAKVVETDDAEYEAQRDIASCMAVRSAGVPWRNSDPMICARTARTAAECSCKFNPVPNALPGFPFTGWVDDQIPAGCRFARVGGADYPYVAICPVSDQEIADLALNPSYAANIGNFCHDRFGVDLVMKLPIRALQSEGSCSETAGFCDAYMGSPEPQPAPEPTTTPDGSPRATDPLARP